MRGEDNGRPGRGPRRARGELEGRVLAALWAAERPLTAAETRERLPDDLAYTTVLTILSRLHNKGLLTREQRGRVHHYTPAQDEAAHTAQGMRTLLEGGSDRAAVLAHFVSELSSQDEHMLQRLLARDESGEDTAHTEATGHGAEGV